MDSLYETLFSNVGKRLRASEIRELLKLLDKPEMISFAGGLPSADAFPVDKLKGVISHVMEVHGRDALQYGPSEGHNKLRDVIARGMNERYKLNTNLNNIVITNGSQQGLDLICKVFLNPGDTVLTECPTYLGALLCFNSYRARVEAVASDSGGIKIDALERKLENLAENNRLPKFLYMIPTFQNPTGVTTSSKKRKKIYDLACRYNLLIIEDDPYGLLRYEGEDEDLIKKYDKENRVIYLGSFSKILAPGFRVAWVCAAKEINQKLILAKQAADLCTNTFGQYCVFEAIHSDILFPHIEDVKKFYKNKRDRMLSLMDKHFPKEAKWNKPKGGLFIWTELPESINSIDLLSKAIDNNVAFVIGTPFFPDGGGQSTFRLNFSYARDEEIDIGIKKLGEVISSELSQKESEEVEDDKPGIF